MSTKDFAALVEKARVMEMMEKMEKVSAHNNHINHNNDRGLVDHLGPNLDTRSGGGHMINPTISPKGLGVFLPSRAECSAIYVEALI